MRANLNILAQIDRYLSGEMNLAEQTTFEIQINQNNALQNKVEQQQLIIQATKRQALLNQINAVANTGNSFHFGKWILGFSFIILLVGSFTYFFNTKNVEVLPNSIAKIVKPRINKTAIKSIVIILNSDSTAKMTHQTAVKLKASHKLVINQKIVGDTISKNDFEFYNFKGLQCWVKPNVQTFEINANKIETIEGEQGTLIIIPENTFKTKNGNVVKGKVKFELIEAYNLADMLLYNLTTTANDKILETGGMFYTNAMQNGERLRVNKNKPLLIQIPCLEEKEGMMAFESEIDSAGNINWKNPKPLEKWLTKIDIDVLDFLPSGFEEQVYASLPIMGFELSNKKTVDSLYQLMGYKEIMVEKEVDGHNIFKSLFKIKKRMLGTNSNSEVYRGFKGISYPKNYVPIEAVSCGINPKSIKIIRNNKDFENSFIATKAFEKRLNKLHKLKYGQKYLDIYLANLDKNLWYSDSLINNYMRLDSTTNKDVTFNNFYKQKKTKVRNGDIYATILSNYYTKKKKEYQQSIENTRPKNKRFSKQKYVKLSSINAKSNKVSKVNLSRGNNYTVMWSSMGWANIDAYLHLLNKGSQNVEISCEKSKPKGNLKIYQWLGAISTLTPIIVNQLKGIVKVPKVGQEGALKMINTYAFGISNDNGKWFFGSKRYNPYKNNKIDIELAEVSIKELRNKLNKFSGTTPLTKQINEELKRKELQKQLKAQQLKENELINQLKQLCFLCFKKGNLILELNIPKAFTPNGDGLNDYFELDFKTKYPNLIVKIYDLEGRLVFSDFNGYEKPWGGKFKKNKIIDGKYRYSIQINDTDYPNLIKGEVLVRLNSR